MHHFKAMGKFKLELQSGNTQFGSKSVTFVPCDPDIWWASCINNRAPFQSCFKLCAIWGMNLKNNRAPLLSNIKLCASFHHHMWIQTKVMVRKGVNWPLWLSTLTSDLVFCMDITALIGNNTWKFHDDTMMGTYWKSVTDRQTDRQTDGRTDGRTKPFIELLGRSENIPICPYTPYRDEVHSNRVIQIVPLVRYVGKISGSITGHHFC